MMFDKSFVDTFGEGNMFSVKAYLKNFYRDSAFKTHLGTTINMIPYVEKIDEEKLPIRIPDTEYGDKILSSI